MQFYHNSSYIHYQIWAVNYNQRHIMTVILGILFTKKFICMILIM